MKHIIQFTEKYENVTEALKTTIVAILTTGLILGLAPAIMALQLHSF